MTPVAGVDGCRAGWIAVIWTDDLRLQLCSSFAEVLSLDAEIIGVDMPIGFLDCDGPGGRLADQLVRRFLSGVSSRVFPAPARKTVEQEPADRRAASRINRDHSSPPKSIIPTAL